MSNNFSFVDAQGNHLQAASDADSNDVRLQQVEAAVVVGGVITPITPAQDGTDATGVAAPAGAIGIRGWLSGIYSKLSGALAVTGTFWQATQPVSIAPATGALSVAAGAAVALTGPPAALTAGADTVFTFGSPVRHLLVQNNSATDIAINFDTPATAGAYVVAAYGGETKLDIPCSALHVFSAAASAVNGAATGGIVLKGWA